MRYIAGDVLQFVGSFLSSRALYLSCPCDPIIRQSVPDVGALHFNSEALKQNVNFIVYLHRQLRTSWLLVSACVREYLIVLQSLPLEMTFVGPSELNFQDINYFSAFLSPGLTPPCWSRGAPRRLQPWARWRTGCRPSAWRDTATTSPPPVTPLQRPWST